MKKITPFEMKNVYSISETENLVKLHNKLDEDKQILSDFECEYVNGKVQYKNEYFQAKRTHLENTKIYNWLVLKYYYEQAFYSDKNLRLSIDYQKEDMKQKGWVFPIQCANLRITRTGIFANTIEQAYIDLFNNNFDDFFSFVIGDDLKINKYYRQAISNYKNQNYFSCAASLFPIIEFMHQTVTKFNKDDYYQIKKHLNDFSNEIDNIKKIYTVKITYFSDIVEQINDLIKNHYFKKSVSRKYEPLIINRNRLMHGLFTRDISQKDCLQLFCVISNMNLLYNMIRASNLLDTISKEIENCRHIN